MADIARYVRTDYKTVDKRDEFHTVMGWLTGGTSKVPIIMDGDRPVGIVNERSVMTRSLPSKTHIDQFMLTTRALPEDATTEEARARMAEYRAAYLPVANKQGKLVGYVRAVDLADEIADGQRAADMAVPVTLLKEEHTIGDALHVFQKEYVDYLPVARQDGKITGVLPRRALVSVAANAGNKGRKDAMGEKISLLNDPVHGLMENHPMTLAANDGFDKVVETLRESGYGIVQDGDRVLGVVTAETIFRPDGR